MYLKLFEVFKYRSGEPLEVCADTLASRLNVSMHNVGLATPLVLVEAFPIDLFQVHSYRKL